MLSTGITERYAFRPIRRNVPDNARYRIKRRTESETKADLEEHCIFLADLVVQGGNRYATDFKTGTYSQLKIRIVIAIAECPSKTKFSIKSALLPQREDAAHVGKKGHKAGHRVKIIITERIADRPSEPEIGAEAPSYIQIDTVDGIGAIITYSKMISNCNTSLNTRFKIRE